MIVAVASGEITAAQLLADVLIATPSARLTISGDSALVGALVWRLGPRALQAYIRGIEVADVADAIVANDEEAAAWLGRRSELALDSAAALIRRHGGDALERAEFARLFAIGEPQEGLAAFLEKRAPRFDD